VKLSIVMPSLNEEQGIKAVMQLIPFETLQASGWECEVILVDGGSIDDTKAVAQSLGIKVIESQAGYGRQYLKGFQAAQGDIIVTGDSDGTYPMEFIPDYLKILKSEELEFITVSRFDKMEADSMSARNFLGNKGLTWVANLLFGLKLRDSQSGMWIFKKEILSRFDLVSKGMPFSEELKIEAFFKAKAKEVPGAYKKRLGKVKLRFYLDGFADLFFLFYKRLIFRTVNSR
jgi:dolichol-phosphate hexosyltransferase